MRKEHNFVSAVIYLHNDTAAVQDFLALVCGQLADHFEHYEIVCVNDASTDDTADAVRRFAAKGDAPLTLVQMSVCQGVEAAMNAGIDVAIGDFVFEFDNAQCCWPPELLMQCYQQALRGNDIVWACPRRTSGLARRMFYRLFNASFEGAGRLREDAFRLLSRRALNRVHAISATPPYRKAAYAACGLRLSYVEFDPLFTPRARYKDPYAKALDSLAMYTDMFYRISLAASLVLLALTVGLGIYALAIYLGPVRQVPGWTSSMLVMCFGFFGVFLMLTVVIKYLSLLVGLVFRKQRYLVEGIEKIQH